MKWQGVVEDPESVNRETFTAVHGVMQRAAFGSEEPISREREVDRATLKRVAGALDDLLEEVLRARLGIACLL